MELAFAASGSLPRRSSTWGGSTIQDREAEGCETHIGKQPSERAIMPSATGGPMTQVTDKIRYTAASGRTSVMAAPSAASSSASSWPACNRAREAIPASLTASAVPPAGSIAAAAEAAMRTKSNAAATPPTDALIAASVKRSACPTCYSVTARRSAVMSQRVPVTRRAVPSPPVRLCRFYADTITRHMSAGLA